MMFKGRTGILKSLMVKGAPLRCEEDVLNLLKTAKGGSDA
jgi:hypothetical protein